MATIADLKLFMRDYTSDALGGKTDRVALRIVNDALRRLFRSFRWSRYRRRSASIVLDVAVAGAAGAVVLGEDVVTLTGETVLQRYVDEGWDLWIEGDDTALYRASALLTPTTFRLDRAWPFASDPTVAYEWRRSRYPLPEDFQNLLQAQFASQKGIGYLDPAGFDKQRFDRPIETGVPIFFTLREDALEVWPPAASTTTRDWLLLTYDATPRPAKSTDPVDAPVDWNPLDDDLLHAAIRCEIAAAHKGQTQLEVGTCEARFRQELRAAKARDARRMENTSQFGLRFAPEPGALERELFRNAPQGADS